MVWRVGWLVPMVWRVGWLVPMVWRVGWLVPMVWLVGVWCRWCGWLVFIHGGVCLVCVDDLSELLLGEAKLQQYLKENPIKQGSSPRGQRPRLAEVRKHLTAALERGNLKPDYQQEATLLMGKLCYVEGDYREALNHYSRVNLDEMQLVGAPVYRLSMIAEAYATRGQYRAPLQPARTSASTQGLCCSKIPERFINMEIFVFCSNLTRGVGRFREILRAVETRTTQNLRMTIARQLAEILLRGMCEQSYWSPLEDPPPQSPLDDPHCPTRSKKHLKIYCVCVFVCVCVVQANRDAVLSRIPEHNADRVISLQSASVVYDLLTIALGRRGQYEMLSECLERAMKFAFEEFHLWYQLALSLMAAGKSARAVKVLKECIRLKPDDATIPLLAVKLCIGNLHWLEEGERFAKMVVDMEDKAPEFRAKGHLALGLTDTDTGLFITLRERLIRHSLVMCVLHKGARAQPIPEALGYVRQALQLQGDDVHSLHLLALLLSAQKHYHDALNIIEMALSEYPENFMLLFTKVKLETLCRGPEEALLTCKHMLQIWKSCYNLTNPSDSGRGSSLLDRAIADRRQLNTMTLPDFSDPETGSVHATSIAASRVEQALSEVASSLQSSAPKQGPLHPWMTLAQIWLHAAEVYIGMLKPAEALACTLEAASLFPLSHNVLFMKGQVAELRGNTEEAKRWYEEALSISPTHVKSMQRLGLILHQLQRYSLAEKVLRDAVQVSSTAHSVWNSLGEVLQAQGNHAAATECFLTALELEASSPVLPFTVIPRTL
uniref:Tetratricopeptide repeat protein 7 N-terminal domain-containing protein n=1 Tax=Pygocentrus nattereri TaxID=42514 RepID=A0AAR2KC29_PYGNA